MENAINQEVNFSIENQEIDFSNSQIPKNTEIIDFSNEKIENTIENNSEIPQNEPQKRKRGRPRKQTQEATANDANEFLKDFQTFEKTDVEPDFADIPSGSDVNTSQIAQIPVKEGLLFLDGLICLALEKLFKKKIDRMEESEAEFLTSLAPSDLQLLQPSKTTFFGALAVYYLSKALL